MESDTAAIVRDELRPDERLLWSGRPKQGLTFRPSDAIMIPFSLLWAGFAIFWETGVITMDAPPCLTLWGIPFVLVGLYLIVGRFFVEAKQREKTTYALTDQRAIIVSGLFGPNVRSFNLKSLPEVNLTAGTDTRGTITFGENPPMAWRYSALPWPGMGRYSAPAFEMIEDAKQVCDLLRKTQQESRQPGDTVRRSAARPVATEFGGPPVVDACDAFTQRGGAVIGPLRLTWPFATLTVDTDKITLSVLGERYEFAKSGIERLSVYHYLWSTGLRIRYGGPKLQFLGALHDTVIFWTFDLEELKANLEARGYVVE